MLQPSSFPVYTESAFTWIAWRRIPIFSVSALKIVYGYEVEWYILCNLNVFLIAIFRLGNLGKDVCRPTKCRGKRKLRFTSHLNLCFRQLPHFVSVFVRKVGSRLNSSSIFIREKVRWGFLHSYALQCDMILKGVNPN